VIARPEIRDRFRAVVARGIARADREIAAHFARLAALPKLPSESRERISELRRPRARRPLREGD
jgi:hypothetical protein